MGTCIHDHCHLGNRDPLGAMACLLGTGARAVAPDELLDNINVDVLGGCVDAPRFCIIRIASFSSCDMGRC
jgi:hypothetical protein